ncbi:MAG: RagB/SusD family nutrient uptake outer membrane protein [Bacteroidales bacterium]|nr:RagB/SusD family nutrient uptake outer membrane protein [Bacteroidales bacterium]
MKNRNINYILVIVSAIIMMLTFGSCEKYLDKAPEADIKANEVYGNFRSYQGFIEELYNCVCDYNKCRAWNEYLFADETLNNNPYPFDQGNYWAQTRMLYGPFTSSSTGSDPRNKTIWPLAWYGIRKANVALSNLDLLVDATQEEKDIIKGQALFFRGWFHFELMRWWGGLPYMDKALTAEDDFNVPRLSYRETALKAAQDFRDAADLLPLNWDSTTVGKVTLGNNRGRINKLYALGYLGKDLLYAASPMMNEESTGTNAFDAELCKQAAEAFAEVLKICDETHRYTLQPWSSWTDNFWVWSPGNKTINGGTEVIMLPTVFRYDRVRWSTVMGTCPAEFGNATVEVPTNNFVKNYAMANGLPIDDPASGFNPNDPWTGREPRFYSDIVKDGDRLIIGTGGAADRYALLYNGGRHRSSTKGSVTGFYYKRYSPIGCNQYDNKWAYFQSYIPYMRLADVYLMYSESVLQGYGSGSNSVPGYSLTAVQAINIVRNRAQLPDLTSAYTATKEAFMGEIIRERAVELAFEGARFHDLRRWNIAGEKKYTEKTAIDFDRGTDGKPKNLVERVVITRVFEKKHNWLPFQVSFTNLYPEFTQNPGW